MTLKSVARYWLFMPMTYLFIAGLWLFSVTIQADESACPGANSLNSELALRTERLSQLKYGLEHFLAGKPVADIPLSVLFTINLDNPNAVKKRVAELQREAGLSKEQQKGEDHLLNCALATGSLHDKAAQLINEQHQVTTLRLNFLALDGEKRAAILHPLTEAIVQADSIKELQEERSNAEQEQKQAADSLAHLALQDVAVTDGATADLMIARTDLEKVKMQMSSGQIKWLAALEQEAAFYQETSEKLAAIGKFLLKPDTSAAILDTAYQDAVNVWRTLVDKTLEIVGSSRTLQLPALPEFPEDALNELGNQPEALDYRKIYEETTAFRADLRQKMSARLQENMDRHNRVLLQSGEIRSQLLNQLLEQKDYTPFSFSLELLHDIRREISIVPYRWSATFYLKVLDIKKYLNEGWGGIKKIAINLSILLAFILIPCLMWIGTREVTKQLNGLRISLVKQSKTFPLASSLALFIQKLLPYSTWLAMLLGLYALAYLLPFTVFAELALILPYVRYYIYYRLFRQLMQFDFIWVNRQIRAAKLWTLRRQVDIAARNLGFSAFVIFSLLSAIESLIRRGLIYHIATFILLNLGFLIAMGFAYQWREVIAGAITKSLHGQWGEKWSSLCRRRWGVFLAIPSLVILSVLFFIDQLGKWSNRFELTKRIATEVFRYRLESTIDKDQNSGVEMLPIEYRARFTLSGLNREQSLAAITDEFDEVSQLIAQWRDGATSVNSIAVIGYKGTGKTCLLDCLANRPPASVQILRASLREKMTSKQQVLLWLSELFGFPVDASLSAINDDNIHAKTLVLVDEGQNVFLSRQGGFEAYQTVLHLIGMPCKNVFWCFAFNRHSWTYLSSVNACHQYFGNVFALRPWPEKPIQDLILSIHSQSPYNLLYDDILQAVGTESDLESVTYIENRFFGLLRQQSRGNPRLAVYLWLSSLRKIGAKDLRVGLPEDPDTALLSSFPEDALFVLASIVRHENLNLQQTVETTQLPEGVVKHVLEMLVRRKLLACDDRQVYRLSVLYQYPIIQYLLAKHCLYE